MSDHSTSQSIVAAQPGFFKLTPWRRPDGAMGVEREAIVAWAITIYRPDGTETGERVVCCEPITANPAGVAMSGHSAILRPDEYVEEQGEFVQRFSDWFRDPETPSRFGL